MKIKDIPFEPGKTVHEELEAVELHDGTRINIPLAVMDGKEAGPTLLLTSGMNGNILNGIEAARRIWAENSPDKLKGRLAVIPIINRPAFLNRTRTNAIENFPGPTQMVGAYPGKPKGMMTERIAHVISEKALQGIDCHLDIGTGAQGGSYASSAVIYPTPAELMDKIQALSRAFGAKVVVDLSAGAPPTVKGRACQIALANGVPSLLSEMGEACVLDEKWVNALMNGVNNVMKHLGMIEGSPDPAPEQAVVRHLKRVDADRGGFVSKKVAGGDKITKGQLIAEISDLFGNVKESVSAPEDAYIVAETTTLTVSSGDRVFTIGVP